MRKQQVENAKIIDRVAVKLGLPGRATLIALMAAMQESSLQNIDHGDADSLGLFQMQPSSNWGTREQILDPAFAAESFFKGRSTNDGLIAIKNWQTRPPGDVAADIEKPAERYRGLYAGHEPEVRGIAKEAGIDLERKGTSTGASSGDGATQASTGARCATKAPTGSGGRQVQRRPTDLDPEQPPAPSARRSSGRRPTPVPNPATPGMPAAWPSPRSSTAGISAASTTPSTTTRSSPRTCATTATATHHPAPSCTGTPATAPSHIAVYLGDGKIASNDILRRGYIDIVDADLIEQKNGRPNTWAGPRRTSPKPADPSSRPRRAPPGAGRPLHHGQLRSPRMRNAPAANLTDNRRGGQAP
ncbi:hypothetical protein GCM10020000_87290 [Streptomyces olivoverticillatus]